MSKKWFAFTLQSNKGKLNALKTKVIISESFDPNNCPKDIIFKQYIAIWDTGATNTAISEKVVNECQLRPVGIIKRAYAGGEEQSNTYFVNIKLPNKVGVQEIKVIGVEKIKDADVLIGMDIISQGDFSITNKEDKTCFSFRIPSLECIDFVKTPYKEKPIKATKKIGRNDPCPCGSGKKYKNCCLKKLNKNLKNKNIL